MSYIAPFQETTIGGGGGYENYRRPKIILACGAMAKTTMKYALCDSVREDEKKKIAAATATI